MARPLNFNPNEAIDASMHAFWQNGYDGVSFDQLVRTTGASRQGLYSQFGDKRGLMLKALKHYENMVLAELIAPMQADDADRKAVVTFLHRVGEITFQDGLGSGCFLCSALQAWPDDPDVREISNRFFNKLRMCVEKCMKYTNSDVAKRPNRDPQSLAHYVVGLVQALSAYGQSNTDKAGHEAFLELSVDVLT